MAVTFPPKRLSAFDGVDVAGDWTLEIFDGFIGYGGTLAAWSLIIESTVDDCNLNAIPDECDVADGTSEDCNTNGVPDECDTDCNDNGVPDDCDVVVDIDQWASTVLSFSSEFALIPWLIRRPRCWARPTLCLL